MFITEANGGGQGATVSYRVNRKTGEVSSIVDRIDQGAATCWTVLSSDQTIGYSVNTGSDTVSLYRINFDGTLRSFFSRFNSNHGQIDQTDFQVGTGDAPQDTVLTQDNKHLFVLNNGDSEIRSFRVTSRRGLRRRGTAPIPSSSTGLMARSLPAMESEREGW